MDNRLRVNLDNRVKEILEKKDKDYFLIIDGMEGSGKSTLAMQIGKYVDNTLNLDRICFSPNDFREQIFKATKGQCIIFDEGFTGLSSRASLSKVNKMLVSLMMQMRQKNLFVIIVLPTLFLLDKYVAIHRASSLIHVFESKGNRGYFKLYGANKKKLLYILGKATYDYSKPKTDFVGRFYGRFALGDKKEDKKYRTKKEKALMNIEHDDRLDPTKESRDKLVYLLHKEIKSNLKMEKLFKEMEIPLKRSAISMIVGKYSENRQ